MKKIYYLFTLLFIALIMKETSVLGQVINPNDPIVNYDSNNPPTTPPWDSIGKWVKTSHFGSWSNSYKAYYYKGMCFRLMFPKSWTPGSTRTYPMVIFLHGKGEKGTIYDNEWSMKWEGQNFVNAENSGKYDGFVMYPQSQNGFWGEPYYAYITEIIDYMVKKVKLDPNRVMLSGLSAGGSGDWAFLTSYPKYFAGAEIISAAYSGLLNYINNPLKYIPIWLSQGGKDGNPAPYTSQQIINALQNVGADVTYTVYPDYGHGVWDLHYAEPDTYPWFNRKNKVNPIVFFDKREFCPSDTDNISITLGLTPGFDGYEWRKNGVVIPGATSNTLIVHSIGTYDARIKRGSEWSYWSPSPAVIKVKPPTQTPDIQVKGLMSAVIPAPDGNISVTLTLPEGYATYQWKKVGSNTIISDQQTLTTSSPGYYVAEVTENGGCSSNESRPFYVAAANGTNPPDPATNPISYALSETAIKLNWSNNPTPITNETAFEIYRGQSKGGPYQLVGINPADSLSYIDSNLLANTRYYYIIRAIDETAAAANSTEVSVITKVDNEPPTAPQLSVASSTRNSISLNWTRSVDNATVNKYFVYVNGVKSYVSTDTSFTVHNLSQGQLYAFYVKAVDPTGNLSVSSNQVTAPAILTGLNYSYYTFTGTWNNLPDFDALTPDKTGSSSNVDISLATQADNFAFKWTGYIQIPASGTYTFSTSSDDGSRLYINTPYSYGATPLVNNDGLHGNTLKSGTITLNAGTYPFTATFYEQGGDAVMNVYWQSTALNNNNQRTLIPDSAFQDAFTSPGNAPDMPSNLKVTAISYDQIDLTWNDNSNNESGFEIYRATSLSGPYNIITTTNANTSSFSDTTCAPETTYYYKIQAINPYGSSGFNPLDAGGLNYAYYETGSLNHLPDFNTLTPKKTGITTNFDIGLSERGDNFAFKFDGTLEIPASGTYTFYTKSDDGSKLYIGGYDESNLVVNNDYLQAPTERSGNITLTAGTYPITVTFFEKTGGQTLEVRYKGPGIAKQLIPGIALSNPDIKATTLPAPPKPFAPSNLSVTAISPYKIRVSWTDNPANVDKFSIYRSVGNNSTYQLLRDVPGTGVSNVSVTDSSLFANTIYYYKVQAKNALDSASAFSSEASTTTLNNIPEIEDIGDQSMRYGTTLSLNIISSDPDNERLTLSATNLPSFASFENYGDGTGLITFNPNSGNQGSYSNIKVSVADEHGGVSNRVFTLTVNDNYDPVINNIDHLTMDAGTSIKDTLIATDQNSGDQLTWSTEGLPSFASFSQISNDTAVIVFNPGYANSGNYNITVKVQDSNGGSNIKILPLSVNFINPNNTWYLNFSRYTSASSPWNNLTSVTTNNLKDRKGEVTNVGISLQTSWWAGNNLGAVTGNNSGVYPDNVIKDYYYFGYGSAPLTVSAKVTGLDTSKTYNFTFFASTKWTGVADNGHSVYSIGGQSVSLYVQNNSTDTVNINNVKPDPDGSITFTMAKGSDAYVGYLNALVIRSNFDNGETPVTPIHFSLQKNDPNGVKLSWELPQFNTATGVEVYRSNSQSGPFSLLNSNPKNGDDSTFVDSSTLGNTTYFYTIRSINKNGPSNFTDTLSITTDPSNPKIKGLQDLRLSFGSIDSMVITTEADPSDLITLTASNLPEFVTFTDLGNGKGKFLFNPEAGDIGHYSDITVTAQTNHGGSTTDKFDLEIYNGSLRIIQINFSKSGSTSAGPWNLMGGWAYANTTINNLHDKNDKETNINIKLLDGWSGTNDKGYNTHTNSGIVPDNVLTSYYYQSNNDSRRIQISGLSTSAKYNFRFISSSIYTSGLSIPDYSTIFSIGSASATFNGYRNKKNFVQLNGISPDANGNIIITVKKTSASANALLNAIIIQEYPNSNALSMPSELTANLTSENKVVLNWSDNAFNETGYTVYRSNSLNGSYSVIASLPQNTSSVIDNSVSPNTRYFYKVQANGSSGETSEFSNVTSITTPAYSIYMNFNNTEGPVPSPWNSTGRQPANGDTYVNLLDENGFATGINLTFINNFEGANSGGVVTGNNSGVFPDIVMKSEYYLTDGLDTVVLKVSGLDITKEYDFTFLSNAGANWGYNNYTVFLINNKIEALNWVNNTKETAKINGISPDASGEIIIRIIDIRGSSAFAVLNAMIIQSHNTYDEQGNQTYNEQLMNNETIGRNWQNGNKNEYSKNSIDEKNTLLESAFPNPFHNIIQVRLNSIPEDGETWFELFDLNGRKVYQENVGKLMPGMNNISLDVSGSRLVDQVYILKVITSGNQRTSTTKLIHH